MIHWNKADCVPLPPVGTRVLVYYPDASGDSRTVEIEEGRITIFPGITKPVAETKSVILMPTDPGWWWAFVGELPQ